jgi:hypothetical protein
MPETIRKRFVLSDMDLDEISLCPSGDNPPAKVVIAKAAPFTDVSKKKKPGANKVHAYSNEDSEKNGETKCDQCGMAEDSPMHQVSKKRSLAKSFMEWLNKEIPEGQEVEQENAEPEDDSVDDMLVDESDLVTSNDSPPREDAMPQGNVIKKEDLSPEVVTYIEALEAEVDELTKAVEEGLEDGPEDSESDGEDGEQEALAKADPVLRGIIEKANARAEQAETIAKAERDSRVQREMLVKAEALTHVSANTEDLAKTLGSLHATDPVLAGQIETLLGAANTQIAKGALFSELGRGGGETTISKSVESAVEEIRKGNPKITKEQAIAQVYEQNPALYDEEMRV